MVTPLTVTIPWLRLYTEYLRNGYDELNAKAMASSLLAIKGKDFARCAIRDRVLTVPVEGGASILKRSEFSPRFSIRSDFSPRLSYSCDISPLLSNHGKWRREHLGAWNAAYGRTPFFIHLMPELEAVYRDSVDIPLEEFNSRLLSLALSWLDLDALNSLPPSLSPLTPLDSQLSTLDSRLSIFDLLFRIGPDALFALV